MDPEQICEGQNKNAKSYIKHFLQFKETMNKVAKTERFDLWVDLWPFRIHYQGSNLWTFKNC